MVIDVRKKISEGRYSETLNFEFAADEKLLSIPYAKFFSPAKVELTYWILEDDSLEVQGKVSYCLEGLCSRCLKETKTSVQEEFKAYFVPAGKRVDEDDYEYERDRVDFSPCIEDTILFSMPFSLSCGENCEGISYRS